MNIGGQDRPIKFGVNQTIELCELRGITVNEADALLPVIINGSGNGSEARDFIWSALKDGARVKGVEFNHSKYDVGDWMTDMAIDELKAFWEQYSEDMKPLLNKSISNGKKKVTV